MNQNKIIAGTAAALFTWAGSALAFQEPYVSSVGQDSAIGTFYLSGKVEQFTRHDGVTEPDEGYSLYGKVKKSPTEFYKDENGNNVDHEMMLVNGNYIPLVTSDDPYSPVAPLGLANQPEVCDTGGETGIGGFYMRGNLNTKLPAYNRRIVDWYVVLPKKPNGPMNIAIQCGTLKPESFAEFDFDAIDNCAGYSGEVQGAGTCNRKNDKIIKKALPKLTAELIPGPLSGAAASYLLTAIKNPSNYKATQEVTLDGTANARFALKGCFTKSIFVKRPVSPDAWDAEAGDIIHVTAEWPRDHRMDVYCHPQSVKIMGIGEAVF